MSSEMAIGLTLSEVLRGYRNAKWWEVRMVRNAITLRNRAAGQC